MKSIRAELVQYGAKVAKALVAVSGGNISARAGNTVWIQPACFEMDELRPSGLCAVDLKSGRQVSAKNKPSTEFKMHLAVYRARPDVVAVYHTHSPWVIGAISAGGTFRPMFAEFVNDLGRTGTVPYFAPASAALVGKISGAVKNHDTIFMVNHGMLALGVNLKQAYFRCAVVEDAAKSLFAASVTGKPRFFSQKQIDEILALDAVKHRTKMMERK
jgi:L-fuculose-phosphate aldolase